jgi:hypothetical protein
MDKIKDYLRYNPDTGIFYWKVKRNNRTLKDSVAGSLDITEGYIKIKVDNKSYKAHRLAYLLMNGTFPKECVDHINNNKSDNRWCNLRLCCSSKNQMNVLLSKNNTSGIKGVHWKKQLNKWGVSIAINYKKFHIGYYEDIEDARIAIEAARKKYHGEFANNG